MKQRIKRSRSDGGAAIRIRNRTNFLEFLGITKTATTKKPLQVKQEAGKEEKKPLKEEKKPLKEEKKPLEEEKKPLKEEKKPLKEEKKPLKEEKKLLKEEKKPLKEEKKPLKEKKTQPCQPVIDDDRVVPRGARRQKQEDGHDTRMLGIRRRPIKSCFSAKALIAKSSGRGRKHHKYLRVRDIAWITAGSGRKHHRNLRARGIAGKSAGRKQRVRDSAGKTPDTAVQIDSSDDEEAEEAVNGFRFAMKSRERSQSDFQRSAKRIVYPCRTELEAIEILDSDIKNLQPSEFLNDTVIDFYIKYIQREFLSQEPDSRFHFFNSFFYKKLSGVVGKKKKAKVPDFSKLRKWTKGINIFKKDYLIIPVHDKLHWSLAIICFPNHGPGSSSRSERCILHLDSMANGHQSSTIFRVLRRYLMAEWKDTFKETQTKGDGIMHTLTCHVYPGKKVPVPLQENESDCGLFVLYYIQKFVKSAPKTLNISDVKDRLEDLGVFGREWFSPVEASNLRISIEKLLRRLFAENGVVPDNPSNISFGDQRP